jgi:perosamine synthetase
MIGAMIPLTVPELGDEESAACARVLRSGMLVQGREVLAFEQALAARTRRKYAIAVASGTTALELALRALEIGPGAEVLCPALTWPSPAHAVLGVGAEVALVDVDRDEWNATERELVAGRTSATRAAIVIEQFGNPARHRAIREALGDLPLVVDAACSLGASYEYEPCGSHGVIACTSFHPRKVLTTGEGGACLTDDDALAERLRTLRNHGQTAPGRFACASGNHRLTELAGAIGCVQVGRLDTLVAARRRLALQLRAAFPLASFQRAPSGGVANHQTLGMLVGPVGAGSALRDAVIESLRASGVQSGLLSYALPLLPQLERAANAAARAGRSLSNACDIAARGLALPLFPSMSDAQLAGVIEALGKALAHVP